MNRLFRGPFGLKMGSSILIRRGGTGANAPERPQEAIPRDWHVGILVPRVFGKSWIFYKIQGPQIPTCRSRNIASRALSGVFASVRPRRVSIDEPMCSPFAPQTRLFINRDV